MLKQLRSFLLPISATIIIPAIIIWFSDASRIFRIHMVLPVLQAIVGVIFVVLGLTLLITTIRLFIIVGRGTLAPWDPTKKFVAVGPYRYTRNPMISGVIFILIGETIIFGSISLLLWAVTFFIINTIYFILSEEPGLKKRFGEQYLQYKKNVPRWLPRLRPWSELGKGDS